MHIDHGIERGSHVMGSRCDHDFLHPLAGLDPFHLDKVGKVPYDGKDTVFVVKNNFFLFNRITVLFNCSLLFGFTF